MIRYADCFVGWRVANTINEHDSTGLLAFDDERNPHQDPDSLLVQNSPVSPFGNPYDGRSGLAEQGTGKPTATVWDCSGDEPEVSPGVAEDPTSSSAFDAAEAAFDGAAGDCDRTTKTQLGASYYAANIHGQDPANAGLLEGASAPGNPGGKVTNAQTFSFYNKYQNFVGEPEADEPLNAAAIAAVAAMRSVAGDSTPAGLGLLAPKGALVGPMWAANTLWLSVPQSINRATLAASSRGYWSTYVQVDVSEMAALGYALPGATYTYGLENCGSHTSGIHNTWDCDSAKWWPAETPRLVQRDGKPLGAVPGDEYHLRDVDCFDGTLVKGVPARASLVDISPAGICDSSAPLPV